MTSPDPDLGYTDLDHRDMKPPFLRLAGSRQPGVYLWTLRLAIPNVGSIPDRAMHSLEHLLLAALAKTDAGFVLAAPMGCKTGLYWVSTCDDEGRIFDALAAALQEIETFVKVPSADDVRCGAFREHDLIGAQSIARWLFRHRSQWDDPGPAATVRAL